MKNLKQAMVFSALIVSALTAGCQSPDYTGNRTVNNTINGAAVGAAVGAAGGLIYERNGTVKDRRDAAVKSAAAGAIIGGATGAMSQ